MRPASLTVITKNTNQVILVLRKDVPVWVLPGGGIDEAETPYDTAQRESWEETGAHLRDLVHAATYTASSTMSGTLFVFSAKLTRFEIPYQAKEEITAFRFFSKDSLPENLFFLHRTILEEYFSDTRKPIERPLREVTWKTALLLFLKHPWYSLRYLATRALSDRKE